MGEDGGASPSGRGLPAYYSGPDRNKGQGMLNRTFSHLNPFKVNICSFPDMTLLLDQNMESEFHLKQKSSSSSILSWSLHASSLSNGLELSK